MSLFYCLYLYQIGVARLPVYRAAGHYDIVAGLEVERVFCNFLRVIEQNIGRVELLAEYGHNAPGERELIPNGSVRRHSDYIRRCSEARHHAYRHAGDRRNNYRFCVYVDSHSASRVRYCVDAVLYLKIIVAETLGVMDVLLCLFDYLRHRADCLNGIFSRG